MSPDKKQKQNLIYLILENSRNSKNKLKQKYKTKIHSKGSTKFEACI